MKRMARAAKRVLDRVFGTAVEEARWRLRDAAWAERSLSPASFEHPHRAFLLDRIAPWAPFDSLLEVGCASGPNLFLLAERYPAARFYGAEINGKAVRRGNRHARERGADVSLFRTSADDLSLFADKSVDLVCSDSALICVGPDKIRRVLREMVRVARRGLVLNEWHHGGDGVVYLDHWVYNWKNLLGEVVSPAGVRITSIPASVWGGNWGRYGSVIEVELPRGGSSA